MGIPKPASCVGCPAYGESKYYVPDQIRPQARVFIFMQNPGAQEEAQGVPAIGDTGEMMDRKYIPRMGLTREDVSVGNALRCRWGRTNELPKINETRLRDAIAHCHRAHTRIPEGTQVILTQGDYALYALTGETSSSEWRGYALSLYGKGHLTSVWVPGVHDVAVLASVHLARLFREPTLTLPTLADWSKVARLLKRTWPQKPPAFSQAPLVEWPTRFSFDTEFETWGEKLLTRYSTARRLKGQPDVHVVEADNHRRPAMPAERPTAISQYAPADMRHLADLCGVPLTWLWDQFTIDDTVWKHATLYSDHPHDLNFLGSLWSTMNRWKHLSDIEPLIYSGADAWGTWEVDEALEREFIRDPQSRVVYETIDRPVIPQFVEAQYRGLRTDPTRVKEVTALLEADASEAQHWATAIAGWPIKLSSPQQVSYRLFQVEKLGRKK